MAPGKGILAADESSPTLDSRFMAAGISTGADSRRAWREVLFGTPRLGSFISGAILYDETIRQSATDARSFVQLLSDQQILVGIKVDTGAKPLAHAPGESVTEGLDGLRQRLEEYRSMGACFAKWRAVIRIDELKPSNQCLYANAHALARYAALCQEQEMVPIVEPEVLMDGSHDIERCADVTATTLHWVFNALFEQNVMVDTIVLKPNMITSGTGFANSPDSPELVAEHTLRCYLRHVPASTGGIALLSGGQSDAMATMNLNAINSRGDLPWRLTFSYGRALQASAMQAWAGSGANVESARAILLGLAEANAAASEGRYRQLARAASTVLHS
ncbi:MAG: fructose-bisphosphate aldolase class I [Actinobacteria bacterium]|nr:fructose-bisphosphate aldolase class I [Actinomycetota bacterium]